MPRGRSGPGACAPRRVWVRWEPWKLAHTEAQPREHGPANKHNQPGPTVPHGATHGYSIEGSPSTTRTSTTPLPPVTPAWYGNAPCGKRPERPVAQGWTCPGRRVVPNVENLGRGASRNRSVRRFPVDFEATHTRRRYVPRAHTRTRTHAASKPTRPPTQRRTPIPCNGAAGGNGRRAVYPDTGRGLEVAVHPTRKHKVELPAHVHAGPARPRGWAREVGPHGPRPR